MEQSVVIKYVSGTKSSAVEQIPIAGRKELIAGRAPSCDIRYDLDADSLVSRRHLKIEIAGAFEPEFTAVDLNSRNGTFINKSRIRQPSKLQPGDLVQLGLGGPEFVFDLDPRSLQAEPPTNKTTAYNVLGELATPESEPIQPSPVRKPRKRWAIAASALVVAAAAAFGLTSQAPQLASVSQGMKSAWAYVRAHGTTISTAAIESGRSLYRKARIPFGRTRSNQKPAPTLAAPPASGSIPGTTAAAYTESLVNVEVGWTLSDSRSGRRVRQVYIANLPAGASDSTAPLIPNAGKSLPLFVLLDDNQLQPVLTMSEDDNNRPIGGTYHSTGFLASANGAILTSRRAATPWAFPYEWPPDARAGVVAKFDKHLRLVNSAVIARRQFPQWVPTECRFILADSLNAPSRLLLNKGVRLGAVDSLTVRFMQGAGTAAGELVRVSDRFDLAVVQIRPSASPASTKESARLRVDSDCRPGDPAVISTAAREPSLWRGKVVALRRDQHAATGSSQLRGARYELAGTLQSASDPGTPVFDAQGRVFAIEIPGDPLQPFRVFAIPIRYALQMVPEGR